jgi:hypothetical protein
MWIGHGNDAFIRHLNVIMFGNEYEKQGLGNICCFIYDYGLIVALLFFYELKLIMRCKIISYDTFLYICCFSILDFNHYVLWTYIITMYTSKQYERFITTMDQMQPLLQKNEQLSIRKSP